MAPLGPENDAVDEMADDTGEKDDECVDHPLDQRQGHHVAVGHMADLMPQNTLHLVTVHGPKQPRAHGHQRAVSPHAGGKGVGVRRFVNSHLGHADARLLCQMLHRLEEPGLIRIARRADDLGARHPLGRPF